MSLVSVPVIKAFTHEGHLLKVGQVIGLPPVTAAILARRGVVSLTVTRETADVKSESSSERQPAQPRRRYRRRDMVAEQ